MIRTSSRLTIRILCISIMGWHFSMSSAMSAPSNTPLPPLPPDCRSGPLGRNILCGCFGFMDDLQDMRWDRLRQDCSNSLNGDINNGRRFCNATFLDRDSGAVQRNELDRFFRFTVSNCATRIYDIHFTGGMPYPTSGPQVRLVQISEGLPKTNHEEYFSGYAEDPEDPSYRVAFQSRSISTSGQNKLKNFCLTVAFQRDYPKPVARRRCCH